jgi:hypothetical protein
MFAQYTQAIRHQNTHLKKNFFFGTPCFWLHFFLHSSSLSSAEAECVFRCAATAPMQQMLI